MKTLLSTLLAFVVVTTFAVDPPSSRFGLKPGKAELKSAGALAFGPESILFVADPKGAAVFAFDVKDAEADTASVAFELKNIDRALGSFLGIAHSDVLINDMIVHPISQNIYLSVSRGRSADATPVIIKVNRKKEISEVKTDNILFSKADLNNVPGPDEKTSWGAPKRAMAITDLQYYNGDLFVAGLSNEEFASRLRSLAFPFKNAHASTSVEIFHTSHNRYETHAPIETMLPVTLNNQASILAGYGCAPLAKFSVADLKSQKHVKGATLAELGGGSRPLDMILYKKNGEEFVLIANSNRSVYKMKVSNLESSQPLTTPVDGIFVSSGTPFVATAYVGVMHIDNLNSKFVAAVQRDIQTGELNLVSIQKRWL
ncbi:MAG TPA: hypothetical protein VGD65_05570 [Chryseosolibacter sp.]